MRKKLLALLMCATMVLGTAATASAATVTTQNYTDAKTIIEQYKYDKGAVVYEYDAKTSPVTFTTEYTNNAGTKDVLYTYAFYYDSDTNQWKSVKSSSDGKTAYQLTSGQGYLVDEIDDTRGAISLKTTAGADVTTTVTNPSTDLTAIDKSVVKKGTSLYYASVVEVTAGDVLDGDTYLVKASADMLKNDTDFAHTVGVTGKTTVALKLTPFTAANTGTVALGKDAKDDTFGMDVDGYIALEDTTITIAKLSSAVAKDYWVEVSQASTSNIPAIANALAEGTISTKAVAVQLNFYKVIGADALTSTTFVNPRAAAGTEYNFMKLYNVVAELNSTDVTFNSDWLSRSNAKNANSVFVIDNNVASFTNYYKKLGTVYKVSDLADNKFSTNYVASGVYIFDYVEPESQNDGVSDTDTTTTTTAPAATSAETAASSPKTGDVAPIAALAVVMMGACGAMVVASKKRA